MSVGPGADIGVSKSLRSTFFVEIGLEPGQSRFLYKILWSFEGVNFLPMSDDGARSTGNTIFPDLRGIDVGTDFKSNIGTDCEVTPLPLFISECSRGPTKESGSFFSLSWVKGPSSNG